MTVADGTLIPARKGKAAFVAQGQTVKVINTHGEQVVDTWAFNRAQMTEYMSIGGQPGGRSLRHRLIGRHFATTTTLIP